MAKKVMIPTKAKSTPPGEAADAWVEGTSPGPTRRGDVEPTPPRAGQGSEPEKMKRLTIDVPADLHRRIKVNCASRGVKMADEIRRLLAEAFDQGAGDNN